MSVPIKLSTCAGSRLTVPILRIFCVLEKNETIFAEMMFARYTLISFVLCVDISC